MQFYNREEEKMANIRTWLYVILRELMTKCKASVVTSKQAPGVRGGTERKAKTRLADFSTLICFSFCAVL